MMSTIAADAERGGRIVVVTKGAPDVLLTRCTHERVAGVLRGSRRRPRDECWPTVERLADRALRTLAVAFVGSPGTERPAEDESAERELVYLGMVGIIDPPRPEAAPPSREAGAAGIRLIMITGDHPRTAARIAGDLGIVRAGTTESLTGARDRPARRRRTRASGALRRLGLCPRLARAQAAHRRRAAGRPATSSP